MTDDILYISLSRIKATHRYRKDYGDVASLAASIQQIGLLQPIGVKAAYPDFELVFGHRRLLAYQQLKFETIPARVIDVPAIVLAEHAENEIRKDFTVSERVEIGKAVEAELGKRQGQRTDLMNENQPGLLGELPVNLPEVSGQETREIAADKAGFGSEKTYRDAKTVTENAEPELVQAMDSGKVAISTAAKLAVAPVEVQRQAVADPKKAVELAKMSSAAKTQEIQHAAKSIEQDQQATFIKALRERQPIPPKPATPAPAPVDPVFETILPNGRKIANGDPKAMWLWGWLLECEDRFLGAAPEPETLAGNFLDFMQEDSQRIIPIVTRYLNQLLEVLHEPVA